MPVHAARATNPATLVRLAALTTECRTTAEYEIARTEWLTKTIDCDMIYQGAVSPERNRAPVVTGVDPNYTATCEASSDRYWYDRQRLNNAAERSGGISVDLQALSSKDRRESVFYREVMNGLGVRATAVAVLHLRGEMVSCIWFGRTGRGARFDNQSELDRLRQALPILALGDAVHPKAKPGTPTLTQVMISGPTTSSKRSPLDFTLTAREDEIARYITRGLTNAEIAALVGTSHATVKNQVAAILKKTGAANRTELAWRASND